MKKSRIPLSARRQREQEEFWHQAATWKDTAKFLVFLVAVALFVLLLIRLGVFDGWFYTGVVK